MDICGWFLGWCLFWSSRVNGWNVGHLGVLTLGLFFTVYIGGLWVSIRSFLFIGCNCVIVANIKQVPNVKVWVCFLAIGEFAMEAVESQLNCSCFLQILCLRNDRLLLVHECDRLQEQFCLFLRFWPLVLSICWECPWSFHCAGLLWGWVSAEEAAFEWLNVFCGWLPVFPICYDGLWRIKKLVQFQIYCTF